MDINSPEWFAQEALKRSDSNQKKKDALIGSTSPTLDYIMGSGDPTKGPLYNAFLTSGVEGTNQAYDSAQVEARRRANMAGFGYEQPAEQTNESAIDVERSHDLGDMPRKALLSTIDPALRAAGIKAGEAGQYSPESFFGTGANLAAANDAARRRSNAALWSALISGGTNLADVFWGNG